MLRGVQKQKHSNECRQRLIKEMKGEGKVKAAYKREVEFIVEISDEIQAKKKRKNEVEENGESRKMQ